MDLSVEFTGNKNVGSYVNISKKGKLILRATFQIIGMYNVVNSMWLWSWFNSQVEQNLVGDVKTIVTNWRPDDITKSNEQLLYFVSNPTFFISYKNIQKIISFVKKICDFNCVIIYKKNDQIIEYIGIVDIVTRNSDESIAQVCL